jgi:hypothetical protein
MAGAAVAALALGYAALAQPVVQNALTGNECWNAGQGPGGPASGFICSFQTRASLGYLNAGTTTTGTIPLTPQQNAVMFTGQPGATTTFNLPTAGAGTTDGQIVFFCNITNAALVGQTITITAIAPATITAGVTTTLTTLAARTCVKLIYVAATNSWGQIQ